MTRGAPGTDRPVWFVSVRSPYSWLAIHDARQRYPDLWRTASLRVFFEPGDVTAAVAPEGQVPIPYRAMSRDKHLYILRDVRRLAADRGLEVTWPVDRATCWEVASLALLCVIDERPEAAHDLAWELALERWQRGGDIGDPGVVASCLRRCGLDERLAWAWQDNEVIERGIRELREVDRRGVFGVPYLIVGREPYWGLDRLAAAAERFGAGPLGAEAGSPERAGVLVGPAAAPVADADTVSVDADGHAGGCG